MEKIANLYLEDFFAWGVCQKIRLTGTRKITFSEIEDYAVEVGKAAKLEGYKFSANFSRDLTNKFIIKYKNSISYDEDSIKLNDNISYDDAHEIFHMGVVPADLLHILLDDENIGKKVFAKEIKNNHDASHLIKSKTR